MGQKALSKTIMPEKNEKLATNKSDAYRGNLKIREAKKSKLASEIYNEILEDALLQTRQSLFDLQDGMKVLKEEYNWQVRNNQRFEKALRKVQDLAAFEALQEKASSFEELRDNCQALANYIERKINKTIDWQDTRKQPSLMQRLLADKNMKKRWKVPIEHEFFMPYEAGDDKTHREVIMSLEYILRKYKVWPSDRRVDAKYKKKNEQKTIEIPIVGKIMDEENGEEIEPIEPVNGMEEVKLVAEQEK